MMATAELPRDEEQIKFGDVLRACRLEAGLTQAALAERAGLSVRAIQHLEAGMGQPYPDTARRLADALELTVAVRAHFEAAGRPSPRRLGAPRRAFLTDPDHRHVIHYTPKHGSWLNMAELELSILQRQCLDRRIPDEPTLKQELSAWEERRNEQKATIDWQFSLENARTKLKQLYPSTS